MEENLFMLNSMHTFSEFTSCDCEYCVEYGVHIFMNKFEYLFLGNIFEKKK